LSGHSAKNFTTFSFKKSSKLFTGLAENTFGIRQKEKSIGLNISKFMQNL